MKQLIGLLLIIVVAVAVTLFADGNAAKVVVFFGQYRIDLSLNFAIIALVLSFVLVHFSLLAIRASGQLPARFKAYLQNRKQTALLDANTAGLIAFITGDEPSAAKALKAASKTGIETDLSYLVRALSSIQADRLDEAEEILSHDKAQEGQHAVALTILKAKIALARALPERAIELLAALDSASARLPQAQYVKLFALIGLNRWDEALVQYRNCVASNALKQMDQEQAIGAIYTGLVEAAEGDSTRLKAVLSNAKPKELDNVLALNALSEGLMTCGESKAARVLLESALSNRKSLDVLPAYHQVAVHESRDALPFVEKLLGAHPTDLRLIELAGDVCEQEQLWGKAISRFETVYARQPSAHLARKLERLYETANQADKARLWRDKLNAHLQAERQPA
ncbi:MAG TPA: heme biosynthesis HemY N-terminal domain-containing protein [Limnobacter sp.]|uniref:heme biosynthesis HemY N-terminal domain-containing protein n=1 Tax=Limnobacter sp. TaxID=2003368 RepID=UPI002EDB6694